MLRLYISYISIVLHYLLGRIFVFRNNKLSFGKRTIIWKSKIKISGKKNVVQIGQLVNLKNTDITIKGNQNHVFLGDNVKIYEYGKILIEGDNCEIVIGSKSTIGSGHIFCGEGNTKITIGQNCMLSREVFINTSDFHSILDINTKKRINPPQNIFIEDHVWIGFNTTVNKGAILRKNTIVASRSVVSGKEYPSNVIIAGIPAKIIKENITWSREKLNY